MLTSSNVINLLAQIRKYNRLSEGEITTIRKMPVNQAIVVLRSILYSEEEYKALADNFDNEQEQALIKGVERSTHESAPLCEQGRR